MRLKLHWFLVPQVFLFFVFVFFNFYLFIYFTYGCVGSSFMCEGFLQLRQAGATLHRGARASLYRGPSRRGAQAPDAQAQQLWLTGPAAPWHVGSSQTRARTRVPCIGRWTLNHCASREAPWYHKFLIRLKITINFPIFMWSWINSLPHVASGAPISQCGSRITLKVWSWPAKQAPPVSLVEIQNLGPHPRPAELESAFYQIPRPASPEHTMKFEKHWFWRLSGGQTTSQDGWLHTIYVSLWNINNYQYEQFILEGGLPPFLLHPLVLFSCKWHEWVMR